MKITGIIPDITKAANKIIKNSQDIKISSLEDALNSCECFKSSPLMKDSEISFPKTLSMTEQIDRFIKSSK